jgi:hypothetical protein
MIFFFEALLPIVAVCGAGYLIWRGSRNLVRMLRGHQQHVELEQAKWEVKTVTGSTFWNGAQTVPTILVQLEKDGHQPIEIAHVPSRSDDVEDKLMEAQARATSLARTMNNE